MAVMTYKELKERGLDHGEKWFGCVDDDWFSDVTLVVKIDFDCENENGSYPIKETHILKEENRELKVLYGELNYEYTCIIKIPNYYLFGDSIEELLEYAKTAPLLCPVKDGCPTFGYKLLKIVPYEYALCILEIPPDAKRTNPYFGRKCHADKAIVKAIWKLNKDGGLVEKIDKGYSLFNNQTEYVVGKTVYPDSYNDSRLEECTNGIHYYSTIGEALELHKLIVEKNM